MRILNPSGRDSQQTQNIASSMPATDTRSVEVGSYNLSDNVGSMECSTMRGPVTITLPRAATCQGRQVTIRKADAGQDMVKILSANSETIDGQTWISLKTSGEYGTFISDGKEWRASVHF